MHIRVLLTHHMKILLDEMLDGYHDKLTLSGYDVYSVKRLRNGISLSEDIEVITHARDNNMILVTKDNDCVRTCKQVGIQHIPLDDDALFQYLLSRLKEM
ncbi:MAG: hypothetical protein F4202_00560 [Cenarchaeum sp. SB0677_bin_16]|nr:hypothetical protein [Cenarchaeum sp. SB0677_bin_16]